MIQFFLILCFFNFYLISIPKIFCVKVTKIIKLIVNYKTSEFLKQRNLKLYLIFVQFLLANKLGKNRILN